MVSRNVLLGAGVVVVIAVFVIMFYPTEDSSMKRLSEVLAKHGVSMGDSLVGDLNRLSPTELAQLKGDLVSFNPGFVFIPGPELVNDFRGILTDMADLVRNYKLVEEKDAYFLKNFPLPCSEIGIVGERNNEEADLIASLAGLELKTKKFSESYGASFGDYSGYKLWLEKDYSMNKDAYARMQKACEGEA